ncbi:MULTISPECIES: hypothetical protein [unclassified Nitratiruptor]|uniref:hypothetical protein n=1 Tax=unclassified Nitratiruptor TaxID=2624044 RepID=UPI001915AF9A|nr:MULTISPECIES: hypothetical protein [unclassified Nitratiruptor]BCD60782.1 hypothetical protein NitYY0810_C1560 [Nitratiruptor sp. YY08-10]BCD64714.1 hypothetical protein NitYY0814_C1568 [Nitratiruptor sp. YY08-14]
MLDKISTSLLTKLLMVLALLVGLYIAIAFFITPDLDTLVHLKEKYKTHKVLLDYAEQNRAYLESELKKYKEMEGYLEPVTKERAIASIKKKVHLVNMTKIGTNQYEEYNITRYAVTAKIISPKVLYSLVDSWQKQHLPIMIDYPLSFQRVDSAIETSFVIGLYTFGKNRQESKR